jgi:hypothetical protein
MVVHTASELRDLEKVEHSPRRVQSARGPAEQPGEAEPAGWPLHWPTVACKPFESPMVMRFWNPLDAAGGAALDTMITQQVQIISYIDDYKLLMIAILSVFPLLIGFKKTSHSDADHTLAME